MAIYSQIRNASHPADAKHYDTQRLRDEHLVSPLFTPDDIRMVYSMYDRYVVGGIHPVKDTLELEPVDALKSAFFLHRREIGIINVGGPARILVDGKEYLLNYKEALFIGQGDKKVTFASTDAAKPAKLYFNSAPAHKAYLEREAGGDSLDQPDGRAEHRPVGRGGRFLSQPAHHQPKGGHLPASDGDDRVADRERMEHHAAPHPLPQDGGLLLL
jgi:5-keto 4-deoxyuronate isomerase